MVFSNESMARFTTEIHNYGNYVLADGSAAQATTDMLRKQLKTGDLPVRFAIPNSR